MITCIKKGHKVTKHYGYYRTFMIWLSIFYLTSIKFCHYSWLHINLGDFPGGTLGKEFACQCRRLRDVGLIPGSGRSPGKGHGNPLQYSLPGEFHGQSGRLQLMGPHRVRHDRAMNTLVIMCDAAMNTSIQISSQVPTLNLLGIYLEVEFLDHSEVNV